MAMKKFNTTAVCIPAEHYMVDISERVAIIMKFVDAGEYFTINRARQYGKTTTLDALSHALSEKYLVISLDFQDISNAMFKTEGDFVQGMARNLCDARDFNGLSVPEAIYQEFSEIGYRAPKSLKLDILFRVFLKWCKESSRRLVLIIDEIDTASNNQVFLDFLAGLRSNYLKQKKNRGFKSFQSVVLAGVTDVKHLKSKIREDNEHKQNSPWNIAADFDIDMSLSVSGIKGMLDEYEADHHTGMDTGRIAQLIWDYTNGYPFLVSRICQLIDIEVMKSMPPTRAWSRVGLDEAVKLILAEKNTLFDSMTKKLNDYPEIKAALRSILMEGSKLSWNPDQEDLVQMQMYGFIRNDNNSVRIDNRIFETRLYNLFLSDEELKNSILLS